jgi:hypothetical protein
VSIVNGLTAAMGDRYADATGNRVYLGRRPQGGHEFSRSDDTVDVVYGDGAAFGRMLRWCQAEDVFVDDILAWHQ